MVILPSRRQRSAPRLYMRQGFAWLYGRALYLPPPALPPRAYPKDHALIAGMAPFRRRLHRQRAAVTVLRALILATLAAILILLVRAFGVAVPLPVAPLAGAGAVLVLCLLSILWQRPAPAEMAHALDRSLGLREQIGSALEVDDDHSRMGELLRQRARATLQEANPIWVLPRPSFHRERRVLIGALLVAGLCALIAPRAPLIRPSATAAQGPAARQGSTTHQGARPGAGAIKLWAIGGAAHTQPLARAHGQPGAPSARLKNGNGASHAGGKLVLGKGTTLQTGQVGKGTHGSIPGNGSSSTASGARGTNAKGSAGAGASKLNFKPGQNSAAGGVSNPQQQALQNLQNSINSAGNQHPPQGQGRNANGTNQSTRNGGQGQQGRKANGGRRGGKQSNGGAAGQRRGANGARSGKNAGGQSQGTTQGQGNSPFHNGGFSGDPEAGGRFFHPGAGGGSDTGAGTNTPGRGSTAGQAQLGNDGSITLSGGKGNAGQLVLSVGVPNRSPGLSGASTGSLSNTPLVGVPGYVAPDSNAITPDERAVVRGYFSPAPGGS